MNDPARNSLPIPTYEEAIASRPASSHSFLGPEEVSNDAEREGLLENGATDGTERRSVVGTSRSRHRGYRSPTVESARSSMDFLAEAVGSERNSRESLRREMEEMEVMDPPTPQSQMSALISKRISSLTNGLSSLNIPFRNYFASVRMQNFRLPGLPEELKPSWILVVRIIGAVLVIGVAYLLFFSDLLHFSNRGGYSIPLERVSGYVFSHLNASNIRDNLEHATKFDHMAGTEGGYLMAKWIQEELSQNSWEDVQLEEFAVYLNYPRPNGRSIAIVEPQELAWSATLEEEPAYPDAPRPQTAAFHGYSKSGNATGPLIYANYGSQDDFNRLKSLGIDVTGAIVLVRYYGSQLDVAMKVKNAEAVGAVACIVYSDPQQDGFVEGTEWPDGPQRPKDSVQRGTVGLTPLVAGDPLSPGFASLPNENKRLKVDESNALVRIPSLPIAWRDAQPLLNALRGKGERLVDPGWIGAVPGVEWWTGGASSPKVHVQNEQDEPQRQSIYNVLGRLEGREQSEKKVVLGGHYDAWCFGATDSGSGIAVLMELIRVLGELRSIGWQPRRTIEFAAWDAMEFNLVGSTEHVESRLDDLRRDGFAYINVDSVVSGRDLLADGSPILDRALKRVLDKVPDPVTGKTLRALWNGQGKQMGVLGARSDYVAFQDMAGTSSIDVRFVGQNALYHSCYDGFEYVDRIGDPEFAYHQTIGRVLGLLVLEMADEPLVPFDLEAYASAINGHIDLLQQDSAVALGGAGALNLDSLRAAHAELDDRARRLRAYVDGWFQIIEQMGGFETVPMNTDRLRYNAALSDFDTNLLDLENGLPSREQYRHVIYAPALGDRYAGSVFPGVRDALAAQDSKRAQAQADRAASILLKAVMALPV